MTLQGTMLSLIAMAVLSETAMLLGGDEDGILGMICGSCAAMCMLNAAGSLFEALM